MVVLLVFGLSWLVQLILGPARSKMLKRKFKRLVAYFYLKRVKRRMKEIISYDAYKDDLRSIGVMAPLDAWEMDQPRNLLSDKHAIDSLGIFGLDTSGNAVVLRVIRRGQRVAEAWLYLRLASGDEYCLPHQPESRIYNTDDRSFAVAGISVEVLEPLRRWRVGFNGVLRKGIRDSSNDDSASEVISVKFNFIWHPMYSYSAYPKDFNVSLVAERLSEQEWTRNIFDNWKESSTDWFEQWGQMHGIVSIEGNEDVTMLLNGTKTREYGILDWASIKRKAVIRGIAHDGTAFHLYTESKNDEPLRLMFGHVCPSSNVILYEVDKCSLRASDNLFSHDGAYKTITIKQSAAKKDFVIGVEIASDGFKSYLGEDWQCQVRVSTAKVTINGMEGVGLVELYQWHHGGNPNWPAPTAVLLREPNISSTDRVIVSLRDRDCRSSKLVGGKGASLALMTSLNPTAFIVPPGLCLTKTSFEQHVNQHEKIQNVLSCLHDVAWRRVEGSLSETCERVVKTVSDTAVLPNLRQNLFEVLEKMFGSEYHTVRFAVRSSAVGEDGEELSAAGQNETFLGVKGLNELCEAIIKCWASQFSFRSIEYKRQNGQLLNGGMGVVLQEMVPAEVAGVLFTRDPLTGSSSKMLITANYGLGESVVSASADPDTVTLLRNFSDKLRVFDKQVGKKEMQIVMDEDGGGTREIHSESTNGTCAISDEMAIRLGSIAIDLEKCFGSARDIEWAIRDGRIYLLQSRPVTSDSILTDIEVIHEFDATVKTAYEKYSTANVAEVMPGAICPLNITGLSRAQFSEFQRKQTWRIKNFRYDASVNENYVIFYNHMFFDRVQQKAMDASSDKKSFLTKSTELGIYGRAQDDEDVRLVAKGRFKELPPDLGMMMMRIFFPGIFWGGRIIKNADKKYKDYPIPTIGATTALDAFEKIGSVIIDSNDILMKHLQVTFGSSLVNAIVLYVLASGSEEFTLDHYSDFATLIGNSNGALSGDVPRTLKKVANCIGKEIASSDFSTMTKEDALNWIETKGTTAKEAFHDFLKQHGHRCINEFDVKSISWGMNPVSVIEMLQSMLRIPDDRKEEAKSSTVQEAINSIKTPLTFIRRRFLQWLLGTSRNLVCHREHAKSLLVFYMDRMRLAYRTLAKLMVKEGFIPEEELLFLITHEEVGQLLQTRSPRIIMRAKRRNRLFDYMHKMQFAELITGMPRPVNEDKEDISLQSLSQVKGFPVCMGTIKGVARVIIDFNSQANTIQSGDILITHATDIGWSPYFPMLGGVVTEIGGLISHGAVVAREYGLPCIICAENATKVFKSGDIVFLDATKGTIDKLAD